ncbi:MAG: hypothetical protein DI536_18005 [Archangium gephyra]|uniref:DUF4124 domain-containing protein n=1 Tax=Archangium gephyra TaxID=48 RepID=A0A2W5TI87_9BACT|nr:MAG: hypothetical protein DI536_18005 [Archangium gephyra]
MAAMRALALAALVAAPVFAQTVYTWEDANGVHYTDDPSQVPPRHRKGNALLFDEKPRTTTVSAPVQTTAQPGLAAQPSRPASNNDERVWRERFVTANRRITTLEQTITALKASLPPRTECVAQPLVPVGTVRVGNAPGAPITTSPGQQVVTQNGYTVVNGGTVYSPAANCQVNREYDRINREIELKQVELKDAKTDLEQLDRQASYDGIPREWRRGW